MVYSVFLPETYMNMVTTEQVRDLQERLGALRRYL